MHLKMLAISTVHPQLAPAICVRFQTSGIEAYHRPIGNRPGTPMLRMALGPNNAHTANAGAPGTHPACAPKSLGATRARPTIPENLTSVCGRCHALIHQGALTVIGRAIAYGEGLVWTTHGDTLLADLRATAKKADNLSIFKLVSGYTDSSGRTDLSRRTDSSGRLDGSHLERSGAVERDVAGSGVSGNVASASGRTDGADFDLPLLSTALTRLGFPKKQSLEVVHRAFEMLDPAEKSEAAILEAALQLRTRTRR